MQGLKAQRTFYFRLSFDEINLTQCAECQRLESTLPQNTLKRCAGCYVTMYYSKEWKKEHWPSHKWICRSGPSRLVSGLLGTDSGNLSRLAGYPTRAALDAAMNAWTEVHQFALTSIATMAAYLEGGLHANLLSPRGILFLLRVNPEYRPNAALETSAEAFQLCKVVVQSKEAFADFTAPDTSPMDTWSLMRKHRDGVMSAIRGDPRAVAIMVGAMPAAYVVVNTIAAKCDTSPLYRFSRHSDGKPLTPSMRAAFADLQALFLSVVNDDGVIQLSDIALYETVVMGGSTTLPVVGRMDWQRKDSGSKRRWVWQADENWNWDDLSEAMRQRGLLTSNLTPAELWESVWGPAY